MAEPDNQLALSIGLTAKTQQLCLGLESGAADILELVTPTTAELLIWQLLNKTAALAEGMDDAHRDAVFAFVRGNPALSEGQCVMLRAGLKKLRKLETDFAGLDMERHPKMRVVCEDTSVSPRVAQDSRIRRSSAKLQPESPVT